MSTEARRAIEAILMVTDRPIEANLLAQVTEMSVSKVEELCDELAREYEVDGHGFVLARVAGGYRYQSHPDQAAYVERFVLEGQSARLSAAALETLAIVAYKQPISRAQIASIRGVNVDGVMRTLQQRGYIDEVGRDPGPGNAVMFGTTATFLERLGLDSLQQLPPLGGFVPGADVVEQLERTLRSEPQAEPSGEPPAGQNGHAPVEQSGHAAVEQSGHASVEQNGHTAGPVLGIEAEPASGTGAEPAARPHDEPESEADHGPDLE